MASIILAFKREPTLSVRVLGNCAQLLAQSGNQGVQDRARYRSRYHAAKSDINDFEDLGICSPFLEEMRRIIVGPLAKWHFASAESSRQDLLRESVSGADIVVAGSTLINVAPSVANGMWDVWVLPVEKE